MKLKYSWQIFQKKSPQISNFMKLRPVGAQLFHVAGETDRHDKANRRFRNFANAPKNARQCTILIWNIFG